MAQRNNNRNLPANIPNQPLDQKTVDAIIENQRLELELQRLEKQARFQELSNNKDLAKQSIEVQERVENARAKHFSKTVNTFLVYGTIILLILLGFIVFCLMYGKDQFAYKFGGGIFYIASTIVAYYTGKKSGGKKESDSTPV